jgi:hypothetical protein
MASGGAYAPEKALISGFQACDHVISKLWGRVPNHLDGKVPSIVQLGQQQARTDNSEPMIISIVGNGARIHPAQPRRRAACSATSAGSPKN